MVRILFVCLGNICRSPTAEGVLRSLVKRDAATLTIEIDSAGTGAWHVGAPPDQRACETAARHAIDINALRARQVMQEDFAYYDYILAMDTNNLTSLSDQCPERYQHKLHRFLTFASAVSVDDVPDPYYGKGDGFETVFALVANAAQGLLNHIVEEQRA